MVMEKFKKVIFALICIVLVSGVCVIAYAAWDDVKGKNTGDLGVTTGDKSVLTCTTPVVVTGTRTLVPDGTSNYLGSSTKANTSYYLAWSFKSTLSDPNRLNSDGVKLSIKVQSFALSVTKVEGGVTLAAADFEFWIQTSSPGSGSDTAVTRPGTAIGVNGVLTSGTTYYVVAKFKNPINENTAKFKNSTFEITLGIDAE